MLARGFRRFERGGKFGVTLPSWCDSATWAWVASSWLRGQFVARGTLRRWIRDLVATACGKRQLFLFVLLHLRIGEEYLP